MYINLLSNETGYCNIIESYCIMYNDRLKAVFKSGFSLSVSANSIISSKSKSF